MSTLIRAVLVASMLAMALLLLGPIMFPPAHSEIVQKLAPTDVQQARPPCADRAGIVDQIGKKYHEKQTSIGMTSTGYMVEIYVSAQGTWTILLSSDKGVSCISAVGDNWHSKPVPKPGEPM